MGSGSFCRRLDLHLFYTPVDSASGGWPTHTPLVPRVKVKPQGPRARRGRAKTDFQKYQDHHVFSVGASVSTHTGHMYFLS